MPQRSTIVRALSFIALAVAVVVVAPTIATQLQSFLLAQETPQAPSQADSPSTAPTTPGGIVAADCTDIVIKDPEGNDVTKSVCKCNYTKLPSSEDGTPATAQSKVYCCLIESERLFKAYLAIEKQNPGSQASKDAFTAYETSDTNVQAACGSDPTSTQCEAELKKCGTPIACGDIYASQSAPGSPSESTASPTPTSCVGVAESIIRAANNTCYECQGSTCVASTTPNNTDGSCGNPAATKDPTCAGKCSEPKVCYECQGSTCVKSTTPNNTDGSCGNPNASTNSSCDNKCGEMPKCYECKDGKCEVSTGATYDPVKGQCDGGASTDSKCGGQCAAPKKCYECKDGKCEESTTPNNTDGSCGNPNATTDSKCAGKCEEKKCYECKSGKCEESTTPNNTDGSCGNPAATKDPKCDNKCAQKAAIIVGLQAPKSFCCTVGGSVAGKIVSCGTAMPAHQCVNSGTSPQPSYSESQNAVAAADSTPGTLYRTADECKEKCVGCGNGVVETGEACDNGDPNTEDPFAVSIGRREGLPPGTLVNIPLGIAGAEAPTDLYYTKFSAAWAQKMAESNCIKVSASECRIAKCSALPTGDRTRFDCEYPLPGCDQWVRQAGPNCSDPRGCMVFEGEGTSALPKITLNSCLFMQGKDTPGLTAETIVPGEPENVQGADSGTPSAALPTEAGQPFRTEANLLAAQPALGLPGVPQPGAGAGGAGVVIVEGMGPDGQPANFVVGANGQMQMIPRAPKCPAGEEADVEAKKLAGPNQKCTPTSNISNLFVDVTDKYVEAAGPGGFGPAFPALGGGGAPDPPAAGGAGAGDPPAAGGAGAGDPAAPDAPIGDIIDALFPEANLLAANLLADVIPGAPPGFKRQKESGELCELYGPKKNLTLQGKKDEATNIRAECSKNEDCFMPAAGGGGCFTDTTWATPCDPEKGCKVCSNWNYFDLNAGEKIDPAFEAEVTSALPIVDRPKETTVPGTVVETNRGISREIGGVMFVLDSGARLQLRCETHLATGICEPTAFCHLPDCCSGFECAMPVTLGAMTDAGQIRISGRRLGGMYRCLPPQNLAGGAPPVAGQQQQQGGGGGGQAAGAGGGADGAGAAGGNGGPGGTTAGGGTSQRSSGPRCGDRIVQSGEQCDDGNTTDRDACTTLCRNAQCGDGVVNVSIANQSGAEGSSPPIPPACGDTLCNGTETPTTCAVDCGGVTTCGNKICDASENSTNCPKDCPAPPASSARSNASVSSVPGIARLEECDDGNARNGDGCSAQCVRETSSSSVRSASFSSGRSASLSSSRISSASSSRASSVSSSRVSSISSSRASSVSSSKGSSVSSGKSSGGTLASSNKSSGGAASSLRSSLVSSQRTSAFANSSIRPDSSRSSQSQSSTRACFNNLDCLNCQQCISGLCSDIPNCNGNFGTTGTTGNNGMIGTTGNIGGTFGGNTGTVTPPVCGNGVVERGESCDDNNRVDTDDCSNNCRRNPDVECTSIAQCESRICRSGTCQPCNVDSECPSNHRCIAAQCETTPPDCGNGRVDAGEQCDDGNLNDSDVCSNACLLGPNQRCAYDFQCDTGSCVNAVCSRCVTDDQCPGASACVSGKCETPEELAYTPNFCGNGTLEPGEACDLGARNSAEPNAACRPDCSRGRCGDSVVDRPLEACDDGNTMPGDGCNSLCQAEAGGIVLPPDSLVEVPFQPGSQTTGVGGTVAPPFGDIVRPRPPTHAPVGDTGPAAIALMAAGGAAGYAWVRRRFGKKK